MEDKKTNKKSKGLAKLFEGYHGDYKPKFVNWGKPQGKEVW